MLLCLPFFPYISAFDEIIYAFMYINLCVVNIKLARFSHCLLNALYTDNYSLRMRYFYFGLTNDDLLKIYIPV